ncbi:MAG: hypothetical protein DRJ40_11810 [Thermoprotei archaeon]|nr:MAG: hypothetical protein DRJ40_11810 [Thermoprotei archaeon]
MSRVPTTLEESVERRVLKVREVCSRFTRENVNAGYSVLIALQKQVNRDEITRLVLHGQDMDAIRRFVSIWKLDFTQALANLRLARKIFEVTRVRVLRNMWKHRLVTITGARGLGKTTYAIWSMFIATKLLAGPETPNELIWDFVINNIFWDLREFMLFVERLYEENIFTPCVLIDDAGIHLTKYWIFRQKMLSKFLQLFDLYKDVFGVMILTTPYELNIAKRVRDLVDVWIYGEEYTLGTVYPETAVAVWYHTRQTVHLSQPHRNPGFREVKLTRALIDIDVTPASLKIPDSIWVKMQELRRSVAMSSIRETIEEMKVSEVKALLRRIQVFERMKKVSREGEGEEEEEGGV